MYHTQLGNRIVYVFVYCIYARGIVFIIVYTVRLYTRNRCVKLMNYLHINRYNYNIYTKKFLNSTPSMFGITELCGRLLVVRVSKIIYNLFLLFKRFMTRQYFIHK